MSTGVLNKDDVLQELGRVSRAHALLSKDLNQRFPALQVPSFPGELEGLLSSLGVEGGDKEAAAKSIGTRYVRLIQLCRQNGWNTAA